MVKIIQSGTYQADLRKLLGEKPILLTNVDECVRLFINNPKDTRLRNHSLHKTMEGK